MALLSRKDAKVPFSLNLHFKYAQRVASVFGIGEPSPTCGQFPKLLYIAYSGFAICLLLYILGRLLVAIDWSSGFDLPKAAVVLSIVYTVQSLFSACFFIYAARSGNFRLLKRRWLECGTDDLVSATGFGRTQWRWFVPMLVFFCLILMSETAQIFLEFYGLSLESAHSKKPFVHFWQLFILIPAMIVCVVMWAVTFYTFYATGVSLSYAWLGFCKKIQDLSEANDKTIGGLEDETLRFVADTHMQLSELTDVVNRVYGPYALVMIILAVPEMFLQLYFAAQMPSDGFLRAQTIVWLTISFVAVFLLFSPCMVNTTSSQVADVFYRHYYTALKKKDDDDGGISEKLLLRTSILLTKLYNSTIYISACGWFEVSKETLAAIFSILATGYFIFLMGEEKPASAGCPGTNSTAL